jgi:hypothetical protein
MTSHWKAVLGVILIYIFGCASGVVSTSIFFHQRMLNFLQHPGVVEAAMVEKRLTGNLGLDANQKQQVHDYFLANLQERRELQKQIQPQVLESYRQTVKQITAILHPDQAELFHQNIEKFRKRWGTAALNPSAGNPSAPNAQPTPPTTNSGAASPP